MGTKNKLILSIEGIRGFAAIYVVLGHIILLYQPQLFFPQLAFAIKTIFGYGSEAVILFFIVSGFSIYYSSSGYDFTKWGNVSDYLFKRGRRIYPLFLLTLIISIIVLEITKMPSTELRNTLSFFFLTDISKGAIADPIPTNFPIWLLSYEVVYYLLYPLLLMLYKKTNIKKVLLFSVILSLIASVFEFAKIPNHFSNVLQLYWIWVIGMLFAEMKMKGETVTTNYFLTGLIVFSIAAMFTLEKLSLLRDWAWAIFFSLLILSYFNKKTGITLKQKLINIGIVLLGIACCYPLTYNVNVVFHPGLLRYLLVAVAFLSVLFIALPLSLRVLQSLLRTSLNPFVRAGTFSYALYILHWPTIILVRYLFDKDLSNIYYLFGIIVINLSVVLFLSYFFEIRLQPVFVKILNKYYYRNN